MQKVREMRLDCDEDVVLLKVEQVGGIACHTGRHSCFFQKLENGHWVDGRAGDQGPEGHLPQMSDILERLADVIESRKGGDPRALLRVAPARARRRRHPEEDRRGGDRDGDGRQGRRPAAHRRRDRRPVVSLPDHARALRPAARATCWRNCAAARAFPASTRRPRARTTRIEAQNGDARRSTRRHCIFCKIVARRDSEPQKVYEDDDILAFHDIHPLAPVHFMIIPKLHIASLVRVRREPPGAARARCWRLRAETRAASRARTDGFRTIINTGRVGRQEVYHLHMHVIGGPEALGPMIVRNAIARRSTMGTCSIWHWLIVLVIVMLVFGTKKLRNIGADLGGAVRGFKDGMKEGAADKPAERRRHAAAGARRPAPSTAKSRTSPRPKADARALLAPGHPRHAALCPARLYPPMFDVGFSELMVIAVVALIVIGPERLPRVARTLGPPVRPAAALRQRRQGRHQPRDGARRAEETPVARSRTRRNRSSSRCSRGRPRRLRAVGDDR